MGLQSGDKAALEKAAVKIFGAAPRAVLYFFKLRGRHCGFIPPFTLAAFPQLRLQHAPSPREIAVKWHYI
jgi:hypothetical protein